MKHIRNGSGSLTSILLPISTHLSALGQDITRHLTFSAAGQDPLQVPFLGGPFRHYLDWRFSAHREHIAAHLSPS
jgi:hypothetical protein